MEESTTFSDHTSSHSSSEFIIPSIKLDGSVDHNRFHRQPDLNMRVRRNSEPSALDESTYDLLSDGTDETGESIDFSSGSEAGDDRESTRTGDHRYDSDESGTEEEDDNVIALSDTKSESLLSESYGNQSVDTSVPSNESDDIAARLLNSTLEDLADHSTEKRGLHNIWRQLVRDYTGSEWECWQDRAVQVSQGPNFKLFCGSALFVIFSVITASVLGPMVTPSSHSHNVDTSGFKVEPKVNVPLTAPTETPFPSLRRAPAGGWPLGDRLDLLHLLTSSLSSEKKLEVYSSTSSASSASATRSSKVARPSQAKSQSLLRPKLPEQSVSEKDTARFYVFLGNGFIAPFDVGRKMKATDRLGPYYQMSGKNEKFKIDYNPLTGKFTLGYTTSARIRGAIAIVISRNGHVLQRGHVTLPGSSIDWVPQVVPKEELHGKVQVLFALPGESSFQVQMVDLGKPGFQWNGPPQAAAAAASDVVRRITDALIIYVEPGLNNIPGIRSLTRPVEQAKKLATTPFGVSDVILRAQSQVSTFAQSFRIDFDASRKVTKTRKSLARMNDKVIKALVKYQGDVIQAVNGKPRASLARAQSRVKKIQHNVERRLTKQSIIHEARRCTKKPARKNKLLGSVFGY
ncbi:hypothetical protein BT63DRAFT_412691 [Microthyrium microscopicum]|uniref:Uncharacterized protein n=1 Tax=Microthyrium microscopicum TaxID=703497 RepID=A0A6A6UEB5_9PEZI|nr:hypothetical protein BT63DRAFT_412691 [Microthyrium microscopicum]